MNLLPLTLVLPLCSTLFIALAGERRRNLREAVTLATATGLFLVVLALYPQVAAGARPEMLLVETFPGMPLALAVEPLGMLFALVASFLWIITSLYAIGYMRAHHEEHQTRFYVCFAIAIASAMGIAFAANMFTLFVFYEVLTLSTYPLVTHAGTEEAKRGGRVYLGLLLGTSFAFLLVAMLWTWVLTGTLDFTTGGIFGDGVSEGAISQGVIGVLFALYVFGIGKAALMPFHRWLPAAMVAPTPVSALLHAVAVVKAGVFTVLKVSVYLFGMDLLTGTGVGQWIMVVAAATILIGSLVAMTKDNLKARLAYSTVSQLSYIVLGALLANAAGIIGAGMHIVMHAFGKITLFFCAGAFMVAAHKTEVSQLRGIGRTMPVTTFAFLIGALCVIGLPPFGGMWSKWYLVLGAMEAEQLVFVGVLMLSALLNIAYLLPIPIQGFFGAPDEGHGNPEAKRGDRDDWRARVKEAPGFCVAALSISALGCFALFLFPDPFYRLLTQIVWVMP
uniref:Multisubunit sodium/proton antiporter, MrpD subunit n=1 Tax=Candidatus Kentrum eta TaxID=2126337 RepID=A0A450VD45_9GAMM|nr:MAG: multisubunit sodium/proton antiporter, MrpD subunit [Candidatus Kentron sp. H]VFJ97220.1 MAG: multisubunit sodium/proton antiporter, MrpD subunit [Candidatus Kentron sp. H]VFK02742.1 MAG: multisubunit sodium/proton antiporter, MrpD subunit [Candidatus Kentron sp. H]